jgi:hypothetical protein
VLAPLRYRNTVASATEGFSATLTSACLALAFEIRPALRPSLMLAQLDTQPHA